MELNLHLIQTMRDIYKEDQSSLPFIIKMCGKHSIDPELIQLPDNMYDDMMVAVVSYFTYTYQGDNPLYTSELEMEYLSADRIINFYDKLSAMRVIRLKIERATKGIISRVIKEMTELKRQRTFDLIELDRQKSLILDLYSRLNGGAPPPFTW